jgi:hypothetical protein
MENQKFISIKLKFIKLISNKEIEENLLERLIQNQSNFKKLTIVKITLLNF